MNGKHLVWFVSAVALLSPAAVGVVTSERAGTAPGGESSIATRYVKCDEGSGGDVGNRPGPLQRAIDRSLPGGSILVSGTCHENVTIPIGKDGITLDGGGTAAITGLDATQPTVLVRARDVTVRAFAVTGNITVGMGGRAHIDGNTIRDSGSYGITVSHVSSAVIVNNTIQNSFQAGILVIELSEAFIGFVQSTDTAASSNVITGNRAQGIVVARGSYARIVGNDISYNGANGVNVRESSSAQISDNTLNGNGQNGILVAQGSGVLLGADTGNTIFTRPNTTTTNNSRFGIQCQIGGYADGRVGSLNGGSGPENYVEGCVDSVQ